MECVPLRAHFHRAGDGRIIDRRVISPANIELAMDRDPPQPLTVPEAKARLRDAADAVGPAAWIQLKPREAVGLALLSGILVGSAPDTRATLVNSLLKLLLR